MKKFKESKRNFKNQEKNVLYILYIAQCVYKWK